MHTQFFLIGCIFFHITYDVSSNIDTVSRGNQTVGCVLPPHPSNGHWIFLNGKGNPGDIVPNNSLLEFACIKGYKLSDENKHVICINGWNREKMPACESLCEPRFSTSTTFIQCFNKGGSEIDCAEATSGSYMKYDCKSFYETTPGQRKIIYCLDGLWSNEKPECKPICGQKHDVIRLIYGGNSLNRLTYPWVVAVYKKENDKFENVCGGTIIHKKAVLTAAHCVTDEFAKVYPVNDYQVAAAKLYRKYEDSRDKDAQYLKVSQFIVHSQYKGESRRYMGDIAIILVETQFKLSSLITPVCFDNLNAIVLHPGSIGEVVGWGLTETGLPSEELRAATIPYKSDKICIEELPTDWSNRYYILDKICAGYTGRNESVCKVDSGCGLTVKNPEDDRHYVHGVVSLAPISTGSSCNIFSNALYTKVSFYYEFIDNELNKINRCILPNFPKNGMWIFEKSPNKVPGDIVSPYDMIEVTCDIGYNLTLPSSKISCETLVSNVPSCRNTSNDNDTCQEEEKIKIVGNEIKQTIVPPIIPITSITEKCGKKVNGSSSIQTDDEETVQHLDHPWVVAIYEYRSFKAHGTIISRKLVISVARFLSLWDVWTPINPEHVSVVTGKYFSNYADFRDLDAQFYGVEKIILYSGFHGVKDGLYGDIGLVVVKDVIEFNKWVQPICVKGINNIVMQPGSILEIVGWVNNDNVFTDAARTKQVVLKTIGRCLRETKELGSYLSQDAICGGTKNSSVCVRDHGAGLVYKNPADERYYLAGIFAFSLSNCIRNNTFYVSIKYHYDFVLEQITKYI